MLNLTKHKTFEARSVRPLCVLVIFFTLLIAWPGAAQQPFSGGDPKGTLLLESGGFIQFEAAEPSIRVGYMYDESAPAQIRKKFDRIFGFGATAKLSNNQGSLFGSNKVAANAGFDVSAGLKFVFTKKFDPARITVTAQFVAGIQRVLREDGTISKDTVLPSPVELASLLTRSIPTITLAAKEKFMASLKEAIKSLGDGTELKTYIDALQAASNAEQIAKLQQIIATLEAKKNIKEKLERLAARLEGKATLAECVAEIDAAINADPDLKKFIDRTDIDRTVLIVNSFEENNKPAALVKNPDQARYNDAIDSLCLALKKTNSFCEIRGKVRNIFDLPELQRYGNFDRLVFQGGYAFRQYNLFNPAMAFADQFSKKDFHSPSAQLIYTLRLRGNKLFGVGFGVEKANNSGNLTEIDIRDFMTAAGGPSTREFGRTRKALLGDFQQYTRSFINTDFAYFPVKFKGRLGINFFTRSEVVGQNKGIRPGIGFFLSKKGDPTKVIGGISVSLDENHHAKVSLITGYNF